MNSTFAKLTTIAILSLLFSLASCSDDKSTTPKEEDKTSTPPAENNTLVSPQNIYQVGYIEISVNNHDKHLTYRLSVNEEDEDIIFNLRVKYPIPTDKSGVMTYITNLNEHKENEFHVMNIDTKDDTLPIEWFTHGTTNITNNGKLNYKYNDNNTITFWTTNFVMSDNTINPEQTRKFSFRFTYNLELNNTNEFGFSDGPLSPEK